MYFGAHALSLLQKPLILLAGMVFMLTVRFMSQMRSQD